MSETTGPGGGVVKNAKGTSGDEGPATVFSEEDLQRARADERKEAALPEDTPDPQAEHEETLGRGAPGTAVGPDDLR